MLQRRLRHAGRDTVQQELLKARVEHAKLLLADPRSTMPTVARESGFGSYEALFRAFKRHTAMPPSHWRRQAETRRTGAGNAERMPERRGRGGRRRR